VSIWTVSTGQNCYYETVGDPADSVTGSVLYTNTACMVQLNGTAKGTTNALGVCGYTMNLTASWASGVRSEVFSGSGVPVAATMSGGTNGLYRLHVHSTPTGTVTSGQHQVTLLDDFNVQMPVSGCPHSIQVGFKGNTRDKVPDAVPTTPSAGFFEDTIVA